MVLPIVALVIGGFASLTMLTKNSFLEEINKQYVVDRARQGPDASAACSTATSSATRC